jgi:3-oxoacyl-[acyl-carrier protein] reductase
VFPSEGMSAKEQISALSRGERPVAIVTGASRGIGKTIAIELAGIGFDIVINHYDSTADGSPDEKVAKKTLSELEARGARGLVLRGDISSAAERAALVKAVKD